MASRFGISKTMNKALKVSIEFSTLQIANQVVNSQSNIPPLVKTLVGFATDLGGYEIIDSALDMLPANMRGTAKMLNKAQATILAFQQLPNLIAAIRNQASPLGITA